MTKIDEEEIAKTSDEIINKIEKFFMTGKGMLYDVHFWKNGDRFKFCVNVKN